MVAEIVARICDPADVDMLRRISPQYADGGDYRWAGHPAAEAVTRLYLTAALRQVRARWWIDRRGLEKRPRSLVDLVDEAGVARANYGGLLATIEVEMTEEERQRLAQLAK